MPIDVSKIPPPPGYKAEIDVSKIPPPPGYEPSRPEFPAGMDYLKGGAREITEGVKSIPQLPGAIWDIATHPKQWPEVAGQGLKGYWETLNRYADWVTDVNMRGVGAPGTMSPEEAWKVADRPIEHMASNPLLALAPDVTDVIGLGRLFKKIPLEDKVSVTARTIQREIDDVWNDIPEIDAPWAGIDDVRLRQAAIDADPTEMPKTHSPKSYADDVKSRHENLYDDYQADQTTKSARERFFERGEELFEEQPKPESKIKLADKTPETPPEPSSKPSKQVEGTKTTPKAENAATGKYAVGLNSKNEVVLVKNGKVVQNKEMNKLPEIPLSKQELEEFGVLQKRKKTGDLDPEDDLDALKRYKKIMSNYLKRLNGELGDVKKKAPEVNPKPADLPKAKPAGGKREVKLKEFPDRDEVTVGEFTATRALKGDTVEGFITTTAHKATLSEYVEAIGKLYPEEKLAGKFKEGLKRFHHDSVAEALLAGKQVSPEVLKPYPDLVKLTDKLSKDTPKPTGGKEVVKPDSRLSLVENEKLRKKNPKADWEMTFEEWSDYYTNTPGLESSDMHITHVRNALKDGKPVPFEVYKKYPNLVKKYGSTKAKPAGGVEYEFDYKLSAEDSYNLYRVDTGYKGTFSEFKHNILLPSSKKK